MAGPGPFNADPDVNPQGTVVHTVDLGDGRVADIEAPANATPEQLWQAYQASQQSAPAAPQGDGTKTVGGFGDELPNQAATQMSPEDVAHVQDMVASGQGEDAILAYLHSKGFSDQGGTVAQAVAYAKAHPGYRPGHIDALPQAADEGAGMAAVRAAGQGATLGTSDEIHGFLNGVHSLLNGGSYSDAYDRTVDQDRAQFGTDEQNHGIATFAGGLAGGALVPVGLEKAGITASMDAVGLAAGRAALREGIPMADARIIAARAIQRRLATEGAAYGGAYGAGSAEGGPGQRLTGGLVGAASGAALGAVSPYIGKGISKANELDQRVADWTIENVPHLRWVRDNFLPASAPRRANELLYGAASDPDAARAAIAERPEPTVGTAPTLAEVAGDTGLAGFQRGVANTDPVNAPAIAERQQQNALARTAAASDQFGSGVAQDVQDFGQQQIAAAEQATVAQQAQRQAAIDQRLASGQATAAQARQAAEQAQASARNALGPVADRDATGAEARTAFGDNYEAAKQRTREAYNVPALTKAQPVNIPDSFWKKVGSSLQRFYGDAGGYVPAPLQTILDDAAREGGNTRALANVDRRLADFAGEAKLNGRGREAAFAESVRNDLADVAQKHAPQEYRDALANAKAVRAEQGRVFETGDAPKAFATDQYGRPTVGDNAVPSRLLRPGAAGGDTAAGLVSAIGPDASEGVVRQELRRLADEANGGRGISGESDAQALATRYGEAARRFPGVQSDLQALVSHGRNLDAAREAETAAMRATATADEAAGVKERSALEEAIRSTPLASIADAKQDPTSFVARSLGRDDNGRQLRQLYSQIKSSPQATAGFLRSLGDYIVNAGAGTNFTAAGDLVPSVARTRKAISTIVSRAGPALNDQQKLVLTRVNRELENLNFAYTASKPAGSETAMNQSFKHLVSRLPLVGKAIPMLSHVIAAMDNTKEVNRLISQAILDPDFAATLLKRPTPKHWLQIQHGMMGRKVSNTLTLAGEPLAQNRVQSIFSALPNNAAANQRGGGMAVANGQNGQQQPQSQGAQP